MHCESTKTEERTGRKSAFFVLFFLENGLFLLLEQFEPAQLA